MPVFVLLRERGPRWDASRGLREQDAWNEHATFMEALAEDGFIFLGGPVGEDRVMHVILAESEDQIVERLAADPWEPSSGCSGTSRSSAGTCSSAILPARLCDQTAVERDNMPALTLSGSADSSCVR